MLIVLSVILYANSAKPSGQIAKPFLLLFDLKSYIRLKKTFVNDLSLSAPIVYNSFETKGTLRRTHLRVGAKVTGSLSTGHFVVSFTLPLVAAYFHFYDG